MEKVNAIKSITYILSGSLLYLYNGVSGGWTSGLAAVFGFVLFIIGLNKLKSELDNSSQDGLNLMRTSAFIGGIAACLDLIPMMGIISGLGFLVAFVLQLVGIFQLKGSVSIGWSGKQGTTHLIIGMVTSIAAALFSMLPFVGNFVASFFALTAMLLYLTGWLKIQTGLEEERVAMEV